MTAPCWLIFDPGTGLYYGQQFVFECDPLRVRIYQTREWAVEVCEAIRHRPGCGNVRVVPFTLTLEERPR